MPFHLIVDGYNVIRHSPELRQHERRALEQGREVLLKKLASYQSVKKHKITVVFDGWLEGHSAENRDVHRGIKIIFSRRGEKADEVIKRLAAENKETAIVVTSDRDLGYSCSLYGCKVVGSLEFLKRMEEALFGGLQGGKDEEIFEDSHQGKGTKKKGPSRRLPKTQRQQKVVMKKI